MSEKGASPSRYLLIGLYLLKGNVEKLKKNN